MLATNDHQRQACRRRGCNHAATNSGLALWYYRRYRRRVSSIEQIVEAMRNNHSGVRFNDLCTVCDHYFGPPRRGDGSHAMAKAYQVRQVIKAIDKQEAM